jgi:hypothetical protein
MHLFGAVWKTTGHKILRKLPLEYVAKEGIRYITCFNCKITQK